MVPKNLLRWCVCLMFGLLSATGQAAQEGVLQGGVNPGYHEPPAWFKNSFLDLREDLAEATAGRKRLLLYFYQDGCPYCAKLLEDNFGQKAIVDKTRERFDVVQINLWGDRELTDLHGTVTTEKSFAEQLRVMFTPTLVFLDEQGGQVLRLNGYYPPHKFELALDYGAGRAGQGLKFSEFMAKASPSAARGQLNPQPFFLSPPYHLARQPMPAQRPLVVFFEQRECGVCDEFHRDVLARDGTRRLLEQFDVVQLDLRADTPLVTPEGTKSTGRDWARQLNVQYAPSLVFFDVQGREVFRTEAYLRAFHVQSALDYVASGAYRTKPSFQRFVQARADAARARGEHVDIME